MPADIVVLPRLVHPWRGGAGAGTGTGRRLSPPPPMSFPPPWVFLDYQDFRAQDLRLPLVPHLGNTVTGYTPKQQATGASPGHDAAG